LNILESMKATSTVLLLLILLSADACAESRNEYMSLSWNKSMKEVISSLAVGDLNGDGVSEVAVAASSEGAVYVYSTNGSLKFKYSIPSYVFSVKIVDVDGDGRDELAVGGGTHLYIVDAEGETVWKHHTGRNPVRRLNGFDIDGDHRSDLLYASFTDECKRTYVNAVDENGSSIFSYDLGFYYPYVIEPLRISNGVDWVLVGTVYRAKDTARKSCGPAYESTASVLLLNSKRELIWEYVTGGGVTVIETADLNGDGFPEVLAGTYPKLYVIDLAGELLWEYSTVSRVDSLAVGDLNGDGTPEVVVGSNNVYILDSSGNELAVARTDDRVYTLKVADLNGDGKSEIVAGSNGVYVFDGKGVKSYQSDKVVSVGDLEVADLDGDGYMEVVAGAVKSVRVYATGFQSKHQQAQAFYNLARQYYMKGDFNNSYIYIEKSRKVFYELGDMTSVSKAISFRDRINRSESGGEIEDVGDVPDFSELPPTLQDSVYDRLLLLRNAEFSRLNLRELLRSEGRRILPLLGLLLFVVALLFMAAIISRKSKRKPKKSKDARKPPNAGKPPAGKPPKAGTPHKKVKSHEPEEEPDDSSDIIFAEPPEKREAIKVKRVRESPRFTKSRKRRPGKGLVRRLAPKSLHHPERAHVKHRKS